MNVQLQEKKEEEEVKDNLIAVVIDIENKELLHSSQRFTKRILYVFLRYKNTKF